MSSSKRLSEDLGLSHCGIFPVVSLGHCGVLAES